MKIFFQMLNEVLECEKGYLLMKELPKTTEQEAR